MTLNALALAFLVTVSIGGIAYVFLYPLLSGERKSEERIESFSRADRAPVKSAARSQVRSRREQVEESLKELELRNAKARSPSLTTRIQQAGLTWTKQKFMLISGVLGVVGFLVVLVISGESLAALGAGFGAAFGVPRWLLSFLKKRRHAAFMEGFPDAVDIIVRGIKAGLPLLDSMKVIVSDAPEPIKSEFRAIIETQAIGLPLGDACAKLYERVPLAEANFFGIVVSIQQKAGGNLSEALGNLSRVLRDRKKMKAKIKAMSTEAKASAGIIGSLPIVVMLIVYISSPNYIMVLFTEPIGHLLLAASAVWMFVGVMTMKKMISFDF